MTTATRDVVHQWLEDAGGAMGGDATQRRDALLELEAAIYERIEEPGRAIKVLERLAKTPAGDPQHIIDLGDRYYQAGKLKRARDTWARIRTIVQFRWSS